VILDAFVKKRSTPAIRTISLFTCKYETYKIFISYKNITVIIFVKKKMYAKNFLHKKISTENIDFSCRAHFMAKQMAF
jgi:hypothetical protein